MSDSSGSDSSSSTWLIISTFCEDGFVANFAAEEEAIFRVVLDEVAFVVAEVGFIDDLVDGDLAVFLAGGAVAGSAVAGRFLLATGISVSGGSMPISTEMAIALGIESQDLPLGAIHFRRRRFCNTENEINKVSSNATAKNLHPA